MTRDRGRNRDRDLAYKRAEYRSEAPGIHYGDGRPNRAKALYDPQRDAPLHHADLTAAVMGDPPIGRRAIDQKASR
jgi:hypothetical protein